MRKPDNPKSATLAVWAGEDHPFWERSTQVPVVHSVSFGYDDMDEWLKTGQGKAAINWTYGAHGVVVEVDGSRHGLRQRHGSHQQYAVHISFPGRSDCIYKRQLRRHDQAVH